MERYGKSKGVQKIQQLKLSKSDFPLAIYKKSMSYIYNYMGCYCSSNIKGKVNNSNDKTKCARCKSPFDNGLHSPFILCSQKHNACKKCLDDLISHSKMCFFCNSPLITGVKDKEILEEVTQIKNFRKTQEEVLEIQEEPSSPERTQKRTDIGWISAKAKEKNYIVACSMIELQSFKITMLDETSSDINAIIDLSIFSHLRFLNLSSKKDQECLKGCQQKMDDNGNIGFGNLPKLQELHMRNRHLHWIPPLGNLSSLQTLGLASNGISRIANLQKFRNLKYLFLSHNNISHIENLEGLACLEILNISDNLLSAITNLSALTKLKRIQLYQNQITKIENLNGLNSLEELDLDDNRICIVENLHSLQALTEIQLSNRNPIELAPSRPEIQLLKAKGIDLIEKYNWQFHNKV